MPQPANLILVDAHALMFQVFHALRQPMTSPDGRPTNAVFGFTRDIFYLRDELQPDYMLFAFDLPGDTFRNAIEPEYKAHRPPPPDDLVVQIPMIQQVVEAFNLPVLSVENYEADDVLATLAFAGRDLGMNVIICTSDKDCRQLLGERVRMYNLRKQIYLDPAGLVADWGVTPEQVIDYQSLVGDSVDNIKGVPGVGAKTAAKLLQEFGTLDNLIANVDKVKPDRIRKAIAESGDIVAKSRKLVTLDTRVPMKLDWDAWKLRDYNGPKLLQLFEGFGFRGFANRVRGAAPVPKIAQPADLFSGTEPDQPVTTDVTTLCDDWVAEYRLIDTAEKFETFIADLHRQKRFAFDLETTGLDPLRDSLVGLAITWKAGEGYYLPVRGPDDSAVLDESAALKSLKPIFENATIGKLNQNIKFDMLFLRQRNIHVAGVNGDPMIADYLLRSGERSHGLDDLARTYLGHQNISTEELIGKRGKNQLTMDRVSTEKVCAYAGEDVDVAWRLAAQLEPQLETVDPKMKRLYVELELPLLVVLADLEFTGIRLDVPFLKNLSGSMGDQLGGLETEIHAIAGKKFNINSPMQLRKILFDELHLPVQRKTGVSGASSTDQETLERLAALHPLPRKIVEYRQVAKLKGTYVDALPTLMNPETGRIHTSFNQTVAATGRLSSSNPNLQNIPARTEQGRQIRQAFLPKEGWQLLTADYSQIELRLLAHCSGDEALKRSFVEGKDIHASVAGRIFGVGEDQVDAEQRRVAKTVNFGVIYGMSPFGLATRLGIDRDTATRFIDDYFARFPAVQKYQAQLLANCERRGFVTTLLGRRRAITGVRARESIKGLNQPEREAVNMEIQGSAADMMKLAMLAVHRRLKADNMSAKMLLTVHDELVLEAPPTEIPQLAKMVREEMSSAMPLSVPVDVDVAAGRNWLDVEEVKVH